MPWILTTVASFKAYSRTTDGMTTAANVLTVVSALAAMPAAYVLLAGRQQGMTRVADLYGKGVTRGARATAFVDVLLVALGKSLGHIRELIWITNTEVVTAHSPRNPLGSTSPGQG